MTGFGKSIAAHHGVVMMRLLTLTLISSDRGRIKRGREINSKDVGNIPSGVKLRVSSYQDLWTRMALLHWVVADTPEATVDGKTVRRRLEKQCRRATEDFLWDLLGGRR